MVLAPRILGSRLVLNLREVYYHPFEDEYSRDIKSFKAPVQFVQEATELSTKDIDDSTFYMKSLRMSESSDSSC